MQTQVIYWILIAVMVIGAVGAAIPVLPGASLILAAIAIWGFVRGSFADVSTPLIVTGIVLFLCIGIDFLAGYIGAKKAGASKWGQIGAFVGLVVGFLGLLPALPFGGPLLGIILGPLLGAIIGEFLFCRNWRVAIKAGIGIVVGTVVGNVIQGLLALVCVMVFLFSTWGQVFVG